MTKAELKIKSKIAAETRETVVVSNIADSNRVRVD